MYEYSSCHNPWSLPGVIFCNEFSAIAPGTGYKYFFVYSEKEKRLLIIPYINYMSVNTSFSYRSGDLEVRYKDGQTPELVKWCKDSSGGEYCYTLCYWYDNEIKFVGFRPFCDLDKGFPLDIWQAMACLDKILNKEEECEDY